MTIEWTEILLDKDSKARIFLRKKEERSWDSGVRDENGEDCFCLSVNNMQDAVRHLKFIGYPEGAMRLRKRALEEV